MNNKTCATCIDNDNGLCDRKGILIYEDDTCDKHKEDWRQQMLEKFDRREQCWNCHCGASSESIFG